MPFNHSYGATTDLNYLRTLGRCSKLLGLEMVVKNREITRNVSEKWNEVNTGCYQYVGMDTRLQEFD